MAVTRIPLYSETDFNHTQIDGEHRLANRKRFRDAKPTGPNLFWGNRKDGRVTVVKRKPGEIPGRKAYGSSPFMGRMAGLPDALLR